MSVRSIFWPSPFTAEMTGYVDRRVPSLVIPCLWLLTCNSGISKSETEGFSNVNRNPFLCNLIAFERELTNCAPKWSCNVMAAKRRTCGCQSTLWTLEKDQMPAGFPSSKELATWAAAAPPASALVGAISRFQEFEQNWVGSNLAQWYLKLIESIYVNLFLSVGLKDYSILQRFSIIFNSLILFPEFSWPSFDHFHLPVKVTGLCFVQSPSPRSRISRGARGAEEVPKAHLWLKLVLSSRSTIPIIPILPIQPFFFGRKSWKSINSWKDGRLTFNVNGTEHFHGR